MASDERALPLQRWVAVSTISSAIVLGVISSRLSGEDSAAKDGQQTLSEETARDHLISRLKALQNLSVKYRLHETYTPEPGLKERVEAADPHSHVRTEPSNTQCLYRYLEGKYWFETTLIDDELATQLPGVESRHEIDCSFENGFEEFHEQINGVAGLGAHHAYPRQLIDLGLGVRAGEDRSWFTPEDLQKMPLEIKSDGLVELQRRDDARHRSHVWQFEPTNKFALTKYTVTVVHSGLKELEVSCSEFIKEGDYALPHRVDFRMYGPGTPGDQREIHRALMEGVRYELHSPQNTPESFRIKLPVGTRAKPKILEEETIERAPAPVLGAGVR